MKRENKPTMYGLNFEPAPLTRGGLAYEIFGRLNEPTSQKYPIIGQVNVDDSWVCVMWKTNGIFLVDDKNKCDLIPAETHAWGNVYVSDSKACPGFSCHNISWYKSLESANAVNNIDRLFVLHRITSGDYVRYEVVK